MKGLYLNVEQAERDVATVAAALGVPARAQSVDLPGLGRATVWTDPDDWAPSPVVRDSRGEVQAVASGWMVFDGRWGDLAGVSAAFAEATDADERRRVLGRIDAGAFVLLLRAQGRWHLITDPFGLHPHYHGPEGPLARLAPAPSLLGLPLTVDPLADRVLEKVHHLFGDRTRYRGIVRLGPGLCAGATGSSTYFDWRGEPGALGQVPERLGAFLDTVAPRPTLLPLSGGLDSRLLVALRSFDLGYTYGPTDSGDRPVARRFRDRFRREYLEFSLLELDYPAVLRDVGRRLFDGTCDTPFVELLAVYRHLWSRWGGGVFFDGYAGDILQRGTLLTHGGARGRLAKAFPGITLGGLRGRDHLRRRYPTLDEEEFGLVEEAYHGATDRLDLDEAHKVLLFEILHGRGARHALNGGTLMSGQYFTTVQPFYVPAVFRAFFGESAGRLLRYETLADLWRRLPERFARVPTPTGLHPAWPGTLARWRMLAWNNLGKRGLHRQGRGYDAEVRHIRWRESPQRPV